MCQRGHFHIITLRVETNKLTLNFQHIVGSERWTYLTSGICRSFLLDPWNFFCLTRTNHTSKDWDEGKKKKEFGLERLRYFLDSFDCSAVYARHWVHRMLEKVPIRAICHLTTILAEIGV